MAYEAYDRSPAVLTEQRIELDGRERLRITGVEDVERFDENEIVMATVQGVLLVSGRGLHIGKLSLEGGELHVDGQIDAIVFEDRAPERGGFFSRLFG
jgi:sporulation protein YabP